MYFNTSSTALVLSSSWWQPFYNRWYLFVGFWNLYFIFSITIFIVVVICISLMTNYIEHLSCSCWPFWCHLWKGVSFFWSLFNSIVVFFLLLFLYILDINLYLIYCLQKFFLFCGFLFILIVSFAGKKLLSLL